MPAKCHRASLVFPYLRNAGECQYEKAPGSFDNISGFQWEGGNGRMLCSSEAAQHCTFILLYYTALIF